MKVLIQSFSSETSQEVFTTIQFLTFYKKFSKEKESFDTALLLRILRESLS